MAAVGGVPTAPSVRAWLHFGHLSARVLLHHPDVPDEVPAKPAASTKPDGTADADGGLWAILGSWGGDTATISVRGFVSEADLVAAGVTVDTQVLVQFEDGPEASGVRARGGAVRKGILDDLDAEELEKAPPAKRRRKEKKPKSVAAKGADGGEAGAGAGGEAAVGAAAVAEDDEEDDDDDEEEDEEDGEERYCRCNRPDNGEELMIECSDGRGGCNGWIHPDCFDMDEGALHKAVNARRFVCPLCAGKPKDKSAPKGVPRDRDLCELLCATCAKGRLAAVAQLSMFGGNCVIFARKNTT